MKGKRAAQGRGRKRGTPKEDKGGDPFWGVLGFSQAGRAQEGKGYYVAGFVRGAEAAAGYCDEAVRQTSPTFAYSTLFTAPVRAGPPDLDGRTPPSTLRRRGVNRHDVWLLRRDRGTKDTEYEISITKAGTPEPSLPEGEGWVSFCIERGWARPADRRVEENKH